MAQTTSTEYDQAMADLHKPLDVMLVISGWPTVYTVASSSYTLEGDVADFDAVRNWMSLPNFAGGKLKGRPESAEYALGDCAVEILDVTESGVRSISDLASRFAYLLGKSSGPENQLNGALAIGSTTVTVDDTTGFPSSGRIWIGQECIAYTGTTATTFTGCTRGSLLTDATFHLDNQKVYGYLPSLYRRVAYIYKGTTSLPLTKWVKALGGPIVSDIKVGAAVALTVSDMNWDTWLDGMQVVGNIWTPNNRAAGTPPRHAVLNGVVYGTDVEIPVAIEDTAIGQLDTGSYIGQMGGEYVSIMDIT